MIDPDKPVQIPEADLQKAATTRGRKVGNLWQFDDLGLSLFIHDIARLYVENAAQKQPVHTAQERYTELEIDKEEPDPIERLRAFCSLAMEGQDWLDVEPYFEALLDQRSNTPVLAIAILTGFASLSDRPEIQAATKKVLIYLEQIMKWKVNSI